MTAVDQNDLVPHEGRISTSAVLSSISSDQSVFGMSGITVTNVVAGMKDAANVLICGSGPMAHRVGLAGNTPALLLRRLGCCRPGAVSHPTGGAVSVSSGKTAKATTATNGLLIERALSARLFLPGGIQGGAQSALLGVTIDRGHTSDNVASNALVERGLPFSH